VIAKSLIEGRECDTLLSVCEITRDSLQKLVASKDGVLVMREQQLGAQRTITQNQDTIISTQQKWLKKSNRKLKLTKSAWALTTALLIVLLVIKSIGL
jgi:hypothetical protein